ncbi:MAG: hypothetical protein IPP42_17500 [Saprospiraceae bacterium]|nr:hypothetical protein [Saprospiraceae bacterium]
MAIIEYELVVESDSDVKVETIMNPSIETGNKEHEDTCEYRKNLEILANQKSTYFLPIQTLSIVQ